MPMEVNTFFKKIKGKKIVVSFHQNGDPDAVGSAVALYEILKKKYGCRVKILFDSISKISSILLEEVNMQLEYLSDFRDQFEYIILVDTNNPAQLGNVLVNEDFNKKAFLIDHHIPHSEIESFSLSHLIKPDYTSTSEIIFETAEKLKVKLSQNAKFLLLAGIIYDSRRFLIAGERTLWAAHKLRGRGVDYNRVLSILNPPKDRSERIARLKSVKRMELYEIGDWLLSVSKVGSFEASACRALIDVGADIAIVVNADEGQVRISSRASKEFTNQTGINLAKDLMEPIGPIIKGQGGGHISAAGSNGTENSDEALEKIKELLSQKLKIKIKRIYEE